VRRLVVLVLGAVAVGYVLSRRLSRSEEVAGNGSSPAGSDELRRFVEASERLHAG
jgi:hypothetical protein